ncbi:hypothetical protein LTR66_013732, partial [Elasticomyces elasticus]
MLIHITMRHRYGTPSLFERQPKRSTPFSHLHISPTIVPLVPLIRTAHLPAPPNTNSGRSHGDKKPAVEPAFDESSLERRSQCLRDHSTNLAGQVTPQQQSGGDDISGGDLGDDERQAGAHVLQQGREEAGEEAEGLQDAVEGGEEQDAGEEEGDLAGAGGAVERAVVVRRQQGEDVRDRI